MTERPPDGVRKVRALPEDLSERDFPEAFRQVCDDVLREHGDTTQGAGHFRGDEAAAAIYEVMLGVVRPTSVPVSLLEIGSGTGRLLEHLRRTGRAELIEYSGVDLSDLSVGIARGKFPDVTFRVLDVLANEDELGDYDYIVVNSITNWRGPLSREQMTRYWQTLISTAFRHARIGVAFNTMSTYVDWERDDLLHVPLDDIASFVHGNLSHHFVIRHDYGSFEQTTYVYRAAADPRSGA